jgi:hypothetical protein
MKDAGLLQHGDSPDSEHYAEYGNRLVDLINLFQTQGLKLWLNQDLSIALTQGTSLYTLGLTGTLYMIKPTRVIQAYFNDVNGITRPLMMISRDEWSRLANRSQQGAINSVFVDKQQDYLGINLWMTPDANSALGTLHLIIQNQVTQFSGLTDTINFPTEWFMALRWGLADDIAGGQPEAIMARCAQKANTFRDALENWDVEDAATQFQPDPNTGRNTGGFR